MKKTPYFPYSHPDAHAIWKALRQKNGKVMKSWLTNSKQTNFRDLDFNNFIFKVLFLTGTIIEMEIIE